MKKALFLIAFCFVSLSCLAHEEPAPRVLATNGYGEIKVKPDLAVLNLQVNSTHKSGKNAKQDVDNRVNDFIDQLKKMNLAEEDMIASSLRIHPKYEHRSPGGRQFVGYEASRNLAVTVRQLERLTHLLDAALESNIEGVDNIRYDSSEEEKHQLAAHQMAIENSKLKARELARAYAVKLGSVLNITYIDNKVVYNPARGDSGLGEMRMAAFAPPSRPGTYLPDKITYVDTIQVTFELLTE